MGSGVYTGSAGVFTGNSGVYSDVGSVTRLIIDDFEWSGPLLERYRTLDESSAGAITQAAARYGNFGVESTFDASTTVYSPPTDATLYPYPQPGDEFAYAVSVAQQRADYHWFISFYVGGEGWGDNSTWERWLWRLTNHDDPKHITFHIGVTGDLNAGEPWYRALSKNIADPTALDSQWWVIGGQWMTSSLDGHDGIRGTVWNDPDVFPWGEFTYAEYDAGAYDAALYNAELADVNTQDDLVSGAPDSGAGYVTYDTGAVGWRASRHVKHTADEIELLNRRGF